MTTAIELAKKACSTPLLGWRTLHIFALCGFAFTQPLLVALLRQTVYLHDQNVGWLEVAILMSILLLIVPVGFVAIDRLVVLLSLRMHGRGRNSVFAILSGIIILSLLRPSLSVQWIEMSGYASLVALVVVIPCSWLLARLYERTTWFPAWMTFAALGLLIFPGSFLWQFRLIRQVATSLEVGIPAGNPIPVVLVVFDEFSGLTLMNDRMEIDARRFPQFARLAGRSTWYRNATTVHPRTQVAVPAILSGRFPVTELSPLATLYPGNLFQVIESTKQYEMAVFEPSTRLCPLSVRNEPVPKRSSSEKCIDLVRTLAAVYPRLIFSKDIPTSFPSIPKSWFGIRGNTDLTEQQMALLKEGLFNYPSTENRPHQFEHFLNCLGTSERPRFCFFHTVFPHFPWSFLPTGEQYEVESNAPYSPAGASGELGEDWLGDAAIVLRNEYRYRLQVGFADRFIGQLLDRLEETGMMDQCLLIVMGDHGVSFRSGHSRRLPDADNLPEILSVPLFVKMPGQTEGVADDRNVESVDILPTIAEVLDLKLTEPIDGIPLSQQQRHPRKTLYFESAMTAVEPDFPQRASAIRRQFEKFGSRDLDQPPGNIASHLDWHGRSIDSFTIVPQTVPCAMIDTTKFQSDHERETRVKIVKRFVAGRMFTRDLPKLPGDFVVAVDGKIVDSGHSYPFGRSSQGFEFLLPKAVADLEGSQIEVYLVDKTAEGTHLKRLQADPDLDGTFR